MMDVLSLVVVAVISVLVTLGAIGVYLVVVERWTREEREEINQRLYEQVQRHYVPCLACTPEGRLCAFHTAELIEQLKAKVA